MTGSCDFLEWPEVIEAVDGVVQELRIGIPALSDSAPPETSVE